MQVRKWRKKWSLRDIPKASASRFSNQFSIALLAAILRKSFLSWWCYSMHSQISYWRNVTSTLLSLKSTILLKQILDSKHKIVHKSVCSLLPKIALISWKLLEYKNTVVNWLTISHVLHFTLFKNTCVRPFSGIFSFHMLLSSLENQKSLIYHSWSLTILSRKNEDKISLSNCHLPWNLLCNTPCLILKHKADHNSIDGNHSYMLL